MPYKTRPMAYLPAKGIYIELNLINVLFGINVRRSKYSSTNFIILLMKCYILCSKYRQVIPNFTNSEKYLHIRIKIEREIAIMKNKLNVHIQKWAFIS